jgi:hypothetical protein
VPKPNGYRALHTTVELLGSGYCVEMQLRGLSMHEEAERGSASHHLYKAQLQRPQKLIGAAAPAPTPTSASSRPLLLPQCGTSSAGEPELAAGA